MESQITPQNKELTDRLINNYEPFFDVLKQDQYAVDFKKKLSISLYDQLSKFSQFRLDDSTSTNENMARFAKYCEKQQKLLTESFYRW